MRNDTGECVLAVHLKFSPGSHKGRIFVTSVAKEWDFLRRSENKNLGKARYLGDFMNFSSFPNKLLLVTHQKS